MAERFKAAQSNLSTKVMPSDESRFILCNVTWMRFYRGLQGDKVAGGGSYIREKGYGHEIFNFATHKGRMYGYVQPPSEEIRLERISPKEGKNSPVLKGVTVVWVAKSPTRGTVVVGWYKNATVHRRLQQSPTGSARVLPKSTNTCGYYFDAHAADCRLLEPDERSLKVPRGLGGMGQANIWYAETAKGHDFLAKVQQLIHGELKSTPHENGNHSHWQTDVAKRLAVEKIAMLAVGSWYEERGFTVEFVHNEKRGWDMEAYRSDAGSDRLYIEVKGLSGSAPVVDLTPNEYHKLKAHRDVYRLAIVINALDDAQRKHLRYQYSQEHGKWMDQDENPLVFHEIMSARAEG